VSDTHFAMQRNSSTATVLVGLSLLLGIMYTDSAYSQEQPKLQMEEVASFSVPDSFAVLGAQMSPSGSIILWASNQPYLLVEDRGSLRPLAHDSLSAPVAAALVENDSVVEVVDAESRALIRITLAGRIVSRQTIASPLAIKQARHSPLGWVLLGQLPDSSLAVTRIASNGWMQLYNNASIASLRSVHMLPWKEGVILSATSNQYGAWAFAPPDAAPILTFENISLPDGMDGSEADQGLWVSLPLVQLDRGFLRTISDLRSDRRLLVLYDHAGRVMRQQVLNVPFGVLAAAPDSQVLVAARRGQTLEVVRYRWRWADIQ
jgi:hypothetical protein